MASCINALLGVGSHGVAGRTTLHEFCLRPRRFPSSLAFYQTCWLAHNQGNAQGAFRVVPFYSTSPPSRVPVDGHDLRRISSGLPPFFLTQAAFTQFFLNERNIYCAIDKAIDLFWQDVFSLCDMFFLSVRGLHDGFLYRHLALLHRWLAVPFARISAHPTGTHCEMVCALRVAVVRIDAARFSFDPGFLVAPERSFTALHDLPISGFPSFPGCA